MKRIAVDIGGTFTDCFVAWGDRLVEAKALTTHHNLALGFNEALENACGKLGMEPEAFLAKVESVRYATTLGTNAMIERKGPRVGLLMTHGFEAVVPISRGMGYGIGLSLLEQRDLSRAKRPDPIVPIPMIRSVRERIDYRGKVLMPLDEKELRREIRTLVDRGAEALVVSLVNSVENPEHELRVQEIFQDEYPPEMLGAIPVVLGHQVSGRKGEYVRTSSAIIDAYLHATMMFAMSGLERNLRERGYRRPMLLVHHTAGMAQVNSTDALQTVHSGPVAGIQASEELARQARLGNVVATDMGGTSFDIGIVVEGGIKHYDFTPVIGRWQVSCPMVHLATLGAGGGSIARWDTTFRSVRVGPESAGSEPGPACYDRGGLRPTVTDADLLLGYLDPAAYAHGDIPLNPKRSTQAMEDLCDELDVEPLDAARTIRETSDTNMAVGLTKELRSRGYRPEDFTMLAYGGNGPLHACGIATKAGVSRVFVPPFGAVFSACGAASLSPLHFHERTFTVELYNMLTRKLFDDFAAFNGIVEDLEARGLADLERQGIDVASVAYRLELDMRYTTQELETAVVATKRRLETPADVLDLMEQFAADFEERNGRGIAVPEGGVRITNFRVAAFVEMSPVEFVVAAPGEASNAPPEPESRRRAWFVAAEEPIDTPVYDRSALEPGVAIDGPAIVNPGSTTFLVEPGWRFEAAGQGAAWLLRNGRTAS